MRRGSTSPGAGAGAFARVASRLEAASPASAKVHTAAHHADVEPLTRLVGEDFAALRALLSKFVLHSQKLAEHDATHGQRLYDAVREFDAKLGPVARRVAEMREHVDDDTP